MKKLMCFILIISSSVLVKAQDSFENESRICQFVNATGGSVYCILNSELEQFNPVPSCMGLYSADYQFTEEEQAFKGRFELACSSLMNQETINSLTGSEMKAYLTPFAQCIASIVLEAREEYGCSTPDYTQYQEEKYPSN